MIRAATNPYTGVNAHANSWMQNRPNGWRGFHHDHITDITRALNAVLPEGYIALSEESLQIKAISPERVQRLYPAPDVTILDSSRRRQGILPSIYQRDLQTPTVDAMDIDEDALAATVIFEIIDNEIGKPVTRIELLSPTNKRPYEGYEQYRDKRNVSLQSGVPLIEIDYLHQQPSVDKRLRPYPDDPDSHAYNIIVSDPRPNIYKGLSHALLFDVDRAIPTVLVPLSDDQHLDAFDLGAVYNQTFANSPVFLSQIDYQLLPERFESYSLADQQRIRDRMQAIRLTTQ